MNVKKVGLTVGVFAGVMHLVWSVLIALGWAQGYLDFVLGMHSLSNPYVVDSFDIGRAVGLIVLTCVLGYIVGSIFAAIFNKLHK